MKLTTPLQPSGKMQVTPEQSEILQKPETFNVPNQLALFDYLYQMNFAINLPDGSWKSIED